MSANLKARAEALFTQRFGAKPDGTAFAPGRVNLIGEHVDYNDGLVLPMPIAQGTAVAWAITSGSQVEAFAADLDQYDEFPASSPEAPADPDWRSYVRGMAAQWEGGLPGLRIAITGDLPRGSGLSSSASLCVALGRAFAAAMGENIDPLTLAKKAQRTEHEYAHVACGIMDQMAIAAGEAGHAMLLDCRTLDYSLTPIPGDWAVLVVNSGVTRGLVDGEYNARREQCEAAAKALGVSTLRHADIAQLEAASLPSLAERRARHVITEISRVSSASRALAANDLAGFGEILREGHASLRDLFEVSVPQVDRLTERLQELIGEVGGARMTGAGFGGSVVAVMPGERAAAIAAEFGDRAFRVV